MNFVHSENHQKNVPVNNGSNKQNLWNRKRRGILRRVCSWRRKKQKKMNSICETEREDVIWRGTNFEPGRISKCRSTLCMPGKHIVFNENLPIFRCFQLHRFFFKSNNFHKWISEMVHTKVKMCPQINHLFGVLRKNHKTKLVAINLVVGWWPNKMPRYRCHNSSPLSRICVIEWQNLMSF